MGNFEYYMLDTPETADAKDVPAVRVWHDPMLLGACITLARFLPGVWVMPRAHTHRARASLPASFALSPPFFHLLWFVRPPARPPVRPPGEVEVL